MAFIQRFSNQWSLNVLYNIAQHSPIHAHIHTPTARQPCKVTVSSSGAVRVRRLAQGQLDIQLGGAGDRTSNLPVTSQPALPPDPYATHVCMLYASQQQNQSPAFTEVPRSCLFGDAWDGLLNVFNVGSTQTARHGG